MTDFYDKPFTSKIKAYRQRPDVKRKQKCRTASIQAWFEGKIKKNPCERCGAVKVHMHHENYDDPLNVLWLCPIHHRERHREIDVLGIKL